MMGRERRPPAGFPWGDPAGSFFMDDEQILAIMAAIIYADILAADDFRDSYVPDSLSEMRMRAVKDARHILEEVRETKPERKP